MKQKHGLLTGFAVIALAAIFTLAGCPTDPPADDPAAYVAVTGISGVPTQAEVNVDLTLGGTVAPSNATNKTIEWSVKTQGSTNSAITGGKLKAQAAGTVVLTATIANGATETTPYTKDFTITVYAAGQAPTVNTVTVSPATVSVAKGGTQTFTAVVAGTNSPSQSVTWSIVETNKKAGTSITTGGVLTVANDETLATLTVKATSDADNTKSGEATVTVTGGSSSGDVTITAAGGATSVEKGGTLQFSATPDSVTWEITTTGKHESTSISTGGLLSVANGETQANLTIKAITTTTPAKSGTITVTVTAPDPANGLTYGQVAAYLASAEGGSDADTPINLKLKYDDAAGSLSTVHYAIRTAQKYVVLDYSLWTALTTIEGRAYSVTHLADSIATDFYDSSDGWNEYVTGITLPSSVQTIGDYAFYHAFEDSEAFKAITLQSGITSIGQYAFQGSGIKEITLPDTIETIGEFAFGYCFGLTEITFPASVTTIGYYAFYAVDDPWPLHKVTFAGSIAQHTTNPETYDFESGIHRDAFIGLPVELYNAYFGLYDYANVEESDYGPGTYIYMDNESDADYGLWVKQTE